MSLIVQKFGGTSLADAQKVHRAARRAIRAKLDGQRVVLVVRRPGRSFSRAGETTADCPFVRGIG
ncbi:MAG: hypothetical protein IIC01_13845 [Planctomycetes bacterium]|nr:hypothetical protein [Planctomycetota bacterium]